MAYLTEKNLNIIRGKALVGKVSSKDALQVLDHLGELETKLDELDGEDFHGTEGWRHFFNLPE
jgi:hypothetical protein